MTTLLARRNPSDTNTPEATAHQPLPSPSRPINPFARPKPQSASSFTRTTLLPTLPSPQRPIIIPSDRNADPLATPAEKGVRANSGVGSAGKGRQGWRLLWRGGVEIGRDGWRLDGITFFALLSFPPTPSVQVSNPFDAPIQALPTPSSITRPTLSSPFPSLPSADTDLCLSLESMRGRKYLQVRGLIDLTDEEVLEGGEEGGVQMSISPNAPLLIAYFTTILCRSSTLSAQGRTTSAILIGLGDEDVDTPQNSLIVYGQRHFTSEKTGQGVLRLSVGRRRPPPPPPSAKKVRPGEPLPRAPLFFPVKAPKKPPPPFPRRGDSLSRARSFSRAPSVNSIYHPPQPPPPIQSMPGHSGQTKISSQNPERPLSHAPVSGRTPGRRGEKRRRPDDRENEEAETERRRKAGRIVLPHPEDSAARRSTSVLRDESQETMLKLTTQQKNLGVSSANDEDIFGKRGTSIGPPLQSSKVAFEILPSGAGSSRDADEDGGTGEKGPNGEPPSTGRTKRLRVPQQVLDNKATIRKQALVMMESRGCARDHDQFKDVFGMTTKGAYFAFRDRLHQCPLSKAIIQPIIQCHLDMYLSPSGVEEQVIGNDAILDGKRADSEDEPEDQTEVKIEPGIRSNEEPHGESMSAFTPRISGKQDGKRIEMVEEEEEEEDDGDGGNVDNQSDSLSGIIKVEVDHL